MSDSSRPSLVLASSSPYRRELLARLRLDFTTHSPDVDERPQPGEAATALAERLAIAKARAVAAHYPASLIIGSDQVALNGDQLLGKPGNHAAATAQLRAMSGKTITFHTAICLLNAAKSTQQVANVPVTVTMRTLDDATIERYLLAEQPYDCAGSARIEALGITLVEKLQGDDPNALIGLPLIELCRMLRAEGISLP